jgi:hypothetical protein
MGNINFDASKVAPNEVPPPMPTGWYVMRIIGAEMDNENASAGEMLKLEHEIDEQVHPEFHGRKAYANLCLAHPTSQQAREIAQGTLSAICHAIGKIHITDTEQLLGGRLQVRLVAVGPQERAGRTFDARNEVKGYKPVEGNGAAQTEKPAAQKPAVPPATTGKKRTAGWSK